MTAPFLQHHTLLISTLSAVHIGCDEDYEPTNYIIDEGLLYGFDTGALASMLSSEQRKELLTIVSGGNALLGVQKFIHKLSGDIPAIATHTVATCASLSQKYKDRIGKPAQASDRDESKVINALAIPRTSYDPYTKNPVLLGSSLKGAIRTALLNRENNGQSGRYDKRDNKKLEVDLLGGSFQTDPLRLIKIGDAHVRDADTLVENKIIWDCNLKKKLHKEAKEPQSISVMREVIAEMNAQSFKGEIAIHQLGHIKDDKGVPKIQYSLSQIIKACNDFYKKLFDDELALLDQLNCLDQKWLKTFKAAQPHINQLLKMGKAMFVRSGRHSGAEGVTVDGLRKIKILQGRGVTPKELDHATTIWLAGEKEKDRQNLIPFGWLFIEIDPDENDPDSQAIAKAFREYNASALDAQIARRNILQEKQNALTAQQQLRREKEAEDQRRIEEEKQRDEAEQARKASLSEEKLLIEKLVAMKTNPAARNSGPGNQQFAGEAAKIVEQAVSWNAEDRAALVNLLPEVLKHFNIDPKKNDGWKKRINALKNS